MTRIALSVGVSVREQAEVHLVNALGKLVHTLRVGGRWLTQAIEAELGRIDLRLGRRSRPADRGEKICFEVLAATTGRYRSHSGSARFVRISNELVDER